MIVKNERMQVKQAIQWWVARYGLDRTYGADKRGRHVGAELMALNQETATAADVAEIIGNPSWARELACNECGKETWDVVELGEPPGHESATAHVCRDCLRAALRLLGDANLMVNGLTRDETAATASCMGLVGAKSEPAVATPKNEAIQRAISVRESGFTTSDTYLAIWRECERTHGIAAPSPEGDAS